jgi:hypothetical protein
MLQPPWRGVPGGRHPPFEKLKEASLRPTAHFTPRLATRRALPATVRFGK